MTNLGATGDYLTLTQWMSPAFPVGSFAYSHGLEWAISNGDVGNASELQDWLAGVLTRGAGWSDAILLTHAMRKDQDLDALADLAAALASSHERWTETVEQGRSFLKTTNALYEDQLPDMALPVAVGAAARRLSLPEQDVVALYLHGFTSNLISAAVRFMPLGQTAGQTVLSKLHPLITGIANRAVTATLDDIATATISADLAAIQHETMSPRLFKT